MIRRLSISLIAANLALLIAGCAQEPYKTTLASGVVLQNGQPLAGIEVQFCPDPETGTQGPSALGETDDQGKFVLRYAVPGASESKEGAVIGTHKVTLGDLRQKPAPQGSPPNPSRIPKIYGSLQTTPLRQEVKEGAELKIEVP